TSIRLGAPVAVAAGTPFAITLSVLDRYGYLVPGYTGTVTITSSDPYSGMLPRDYTFMPGDNGRQTVTGGTPFTAGMHMLIAEDKAHASITGSAVIRVKAAPANHFSLTAPSSTVSGVPFDVAVAALDPYSNVDTNYTGTVAFTGTDTDPGVVLPAQYTFQA